jgi:hypothetical protein
MTSPREGRGPRRCGRLPGLMFPLWLRLGEGVVIPQDYPSFLGGI